jgi:transposase
LAFVDETGFLLIPNVRKTWAPVGQTPQLRHSYRRDRLSTISALTVSPLRQRMGLYVRFHPQNITGLEVLAFLRHLLRHLRGTVVLLWDGNPIHRRRLVGEYLAQRRGRLHVYRLPAYAPELNPDEFVWTQAKSALANSTPENLAQLDHAVRGSVRRLCRSQRLLWACIHASDLPW